MPNKQGAILVFTSRRSPRLTYIFDLLLQDLLGLEYTFTSDKSSFTAFNGPKFSYCEHAVGDELFFFASRFLFEKGIEDQQINVFEWKGMPAFFGTHPKYEIPFDLFAASFFLVSRYEEYLPHIKDNHLRFSPQQSLAYQKNFLHRPMVNLWANELKLVLQARYPGMNFKEHNYRYISTFDIDSAYAYREKGLVRNIGAFLIGIFGLQFKKVAERARVLLGLQADPYDTYEWQLKFAQDHHVKQIYFILCGDYGEFDKNIPVQGSRVFQSLIKSIADYAEVGIHPSYASNNTKSMLSVEIRRLSKVLKSEVVLSRQHFLKVTFPDTYRNLIEHDIEEDYSLGYASEIGFRASICSPFPFYDLDLDIPTRLRLVPFMLMDGTMKDYMRLSPAQAIDRAKALIDEVKAVKGTFVTLWHNQSVNGREEWSGWREVYEEIVKYASEPKQETVYPA
ncbi:MAG: polysaccharide deacetylase family protein [Bacteroidota bacterium]